MSTVTLPAYVPFSSTVYIPPLEVRKRRLSRLQDQISDSQNSCIEVNGSTPELLHWDNEENSLQIWPWPCYQNGRRVSPDALEQHCLTYYFRPPCCLCSYLHGTRSYTASKIRLMESVNPTRNPEDQIRRPFVGEYVAECATNTCGYFVVLERFFSQKVLKVVRHYKRPKPYDPHALDFLKEVSEADDVEDRMGGFRRIFTGSSSESDGFSRGSNKLKRAFDECEEHVDDSACQLKKLGSQGLADSEFWDLFIQCAACNFVIPRNLYPYQHHCSKRARSPEEFDDERGIETVDKGEGTSAQTLGQGAGHDGAASVAAESQGSVGGMGAVVHGTVSDPIGTGWDKLLEIMEQEAEVSDDDNLPHILDLLGVTVSSQ